jgi:CRISPR-associated protein Cmr1
MPIRPSSIRGHLRFWWRATRGAGFDTAQLRRQESKIWGSTENPSPVIIEVVIVDRGKEYPCATTRGRILKFENNHPPYALFPFQGDKNKNPAQCISGLIFDLITICPESLEGEISPAIKAWVNFGGIGARTRRGCGALYCKDLAPPDGESVGSWYKSYFARDKKNQKPKWPLLPEKILVKHNDGDNDPLKIWSEVIGLMHDFRQGFIGRNPGHDRRPGRSRWPEPETIRQTSSRRSSQHSRLHAIPDDAFPRAEFGLPIVFHFKDRDDPNDTELYPVVNGEEKTRMASSLILRPVICANGEMVQMILRLKSPSVEEVVLNKAPHNPHFTNIRNPQLAKYQNSPLGIPKNGSPSRSPSGSALEAFISFAKENGFVEVPQ